jgi:hypothetical protein
MVDNQGVDARVFLVLSASADANDHAMEDSVFLSTENPSIDQHGYPSHKM